MISKFELEELLEELKKIRGSHTELVTVYIPAGQNINVVAKQVEEEKGTASNIKSKTTRKNVIDALESISRELKKYKQTPENGMVVFAGNISEKEGQSQIELWAIEPPQALKTRIYRCDKEFVLDALKEMLEVTEVYGLVVMDRREATLGLLEGKQIKVLRKMTSGVPGKTEKGGQCLSPDTLIMKSDGEIIEIKNAHNPLIIVSENFNKEESEGTPLIEKWENKKQLYDITTYYPRLEIKASANHIFFVRTDKGIEEKPLLSIKKGDYLIVPEKISLNLDYQKLRFIPGVVKATNLNKVKIPSYVNEDFARILGYYLGDGNYEKTRLTFSEQRRDVAYYYKQLMEETFGVEVKYRFRESKNYHQLRLHSLIIAQLFKEIFKQNNKTLNEKTPTIILKSPNSVLAGFLAGFFDAEGYISGNRIGLGINNGYLLRQLQFSLLRLGIISSFWVYNNRKNPYSKNYRYTLSIEDNVSLEKFRDLINFSSEEKQEKLKFAIKNKSKTSKIRQVAVNGKEVANILRNSGLRTDDFHNPQFFVNKRQMSKEIFKLRILNKIKDEELRRRLEMFYNSNLIVVKIAKIEELEETTTIDIETKNHNFIANGLIVHNSAARFARIREGLAKEFYRRIANTMKEIYFDMPKLKGIIIGGPVPTKEDFLKEGDLTTKLKDLVIGMKDIGQTDESGLKDLVEASHDLLEKQEIIYEKKLLERFFELLGKGKKALYKKKDIEKAISYGAVETLILSKKLERKEALELEKKASSISAKIEIVSDETEEGKQFLSLGGIGAILRFEI